MFGYTKGLTWGTVARQRDNSHYVFIFLFFVFYLGGSHTW